MKGVVALVLAVFLACGIVAATPCLVPPEQYEQFCENQLVSGNGVMYSDVSIVDKYIALNYYETMSNVGQPSANIEIDSTHLYSQTALNQSLPCDDPGNDTTTLNFYENTKMAFDGQQAVPGAAPSILDGTKYLESKGFYGGIDANVQEFYSVQQLEKDQKAFFGSTCNSTIAHTVGLDTANSFNGTWGTSANMHKIFYKDISSNEWFSGEFEVAKTLKFHELATGPAPSGNPCCVIDC
ncbi:hypothetical protein D4R47_01420 [archaeon]|nr:MAG: hypothetical protein D4R47_01420 [archaeon]